MATHLRDPDVDKEFRKPMTNLEGVRRICDDISDRVRTLLAGVTAHASAR